MPVKLRPPKKYPSAVLRLSRRSCQVAYKATAAVNAIKVESCANISGKVRISKKKSKKLFPAWQLKNFSGCQESSQLQDCS